jgi:hypothetical protein
MSAIQTKVLVAILAVLVVIAGVLLRGGRTVEATRQTDASAPAEKRFKQFATPSKKHQLIP